MSRELSQSPPADQKPPVKAFAVLEKCENTGDIYFAPKAIYAAKMGANQYGDGDLGGVQCRRAKWADGYANTGVPAKVAVDHGWHFECFGCGVKIDSDLEIEHGLSVNGVCGTMHGRVFCSAKCKWKHLLTEARKEAEEAAAIRDFKEIVLARFPDAEFQDDADRFRGHHAYVNREYGQRVWHRSQVIISFAFPGMKIGPAHYRMDPFHKIGPPIAGYTCCNGDKEAFEAWAATCKPASSFTPNGGEAL